MRTDIHALSGAYALDALDSEERTEFEKHLDSCEACRAEVASLTETATTLARLTETPPPPGVRERVLADISRVRPLPPQVRPTPARRWWTGLAAAAAAAVIVVGGAVWQPWDDPASPVTFETVAAASDVQELDATLDDGSSLTVYRSADLDRVAVVGHDMAPLDDGLVYQVWLQDDAGQMLPAGLMPTGERAALLLDGSATGSDAVGITIEPAGGSPAPTSDPIAVVAFDQA